MRGALALAHPFSARRRGAAPWWLADGHRLDGIAPVLAADFARGRFALAGASVPLSSVLAVSSGAKRVVDASGALVTVPANTPAFARRSGRPRLLIEGPATNLALDSAAIHSWLATGTQSPTRTGNAVLAPDGTMTGTQLDYPAATGTSFGSVYRLITSPAASPAYAFSVWLRGALGGETVYLTWTKSSSVHQTIACTLTSQWQRFVLVSTLDTSGANYINIGRDGRAGNADTPAQTIYAWGAQIEAGEIATSYVPTTAAAASRIADVVQLTAGAAAALQGVAASYAWRVRVPVTAASLPMLGLGSGYALLRAGPSPGTSLRLDGSSVATISLGAALPGEIGAVGAWDGSGRAGAVNGGAALSDSNTMDRSRASIWLGGYQGLPAGCALEIDELVAWATRGSGAALTGQARGWA
ncbi:phage head spike fiber domain-containing protein [Xanthobacter tagetidis]|uniref:phage head spike fiber domain-containing protein n=1 Tax=Xanthobacter tagetidis TaxID=60216 RepID=UPI00147356DE|nr:hypothetical protein [Xanthobacter tagetidis]MBB6308896.1 hypothetical protein [Xanthobacter tagetidis]